MQRQAGPPQFDYQPGYRQGAPNGDYSNEPFDDFGASRVRSVARRRGVWGLWLRLTAPAPDPSAMMDRQLRERQRRAELTSAVAPFVLLSGLLLAQQAVADPITAGGIVAIWVAVILALIFNRAGAQTLAAVLLILGMDGSVEGALITAHGGIGAAWLPTFDLFVVPLIAVGFLLSRRYIPLFAGLHIAMIIGDFFLLPHNADLAPLIQVWGTGVAFQRALILQVMGAALSYVAARSTDQAIARADRAEDVAAMEHQLVEQQRQVEVGMQQILQTHIRVANGDFSARAPLGQDNVLFQIASSLNNLLNRLGRAAQSQFQLQRTVQEITRLRDSLMAARAGRPPLWPAPSGTPVDMLIEVIANPERGSALQPPLAIPNSGPQFGPMGPMGSSGPLGPAGPVGSGRLVAGGAGFAPAVPQIGPQGWRPDQPPFGQPNPGGAFPGGTFPGGASSGAPSGPGFPPAPFGASPAPSGQLAPFGPGAPLGPSGPTGGAGPFDAPPFGQPDPYGRDQAPAMPTIPTMPANHPPEPPAFPALDPAYSAPQAPNGADAGAPGAQNTGSWDMPPLPDWLNPQESDN